MASQPTLSSSTAAAPLATVVDSSTMNENEDGELESSLRNIIEQVTALPLLLQCPSVIHHPSPMCHVGVGVGVGVGMHRNPFDGSLWVVKVVSERQLHHAHLLFN
jgi:hypothetical protein